MEFTLARLEYLNPSDLAPEDQKLLAQPGNLFRALAHSPGGLRAVLRFGNWDRYHSGLDPRLRELAILQVGYVTGSDYEYAHHLKIGRDAGLNDPELRAISSETAGGRGDIGELERLVLRAAREMTADSTLSDETFTGLCEELPNEHLIDLILTIAFYNAIVRVLSALRIDLEVDYEALLEAFPLARG